MQLFAIETVCENAKCHLVLGNGMEWNGADTSCQAHILRSGQEMK